jgi:RNA polymerase sigma-70 factor (ECF subfamily)
VKVQKEVMAFARPVQLSVVPGVAALDDSTLIARVRAGDAAMANALVLRAGPRAKAAVRRLLRFGSADDGDLTQLILIELVTTIDSFRGDCSLNTWIDRIAAHVVYKHLRRKKLESRLFEGLAEEGEQVPSGATSGERQALLRNILGRVRERLTHLDEEKVSTWLLFEVHGLSLSELAHAMEISLAAAQSRISRARREVRACLEGDVELLGVLSSLEASP